MLGDTWNKNITKNTERLFGKHRTVGEDLLGYARNKAVIIVGAGPSFNKNKDILKAIYEYNLTFAPTQEPFVIIASNHQLKPLLEMGIHPHLTFVVDGGNHFRDHFINLKTDMKCVMVANLACDHKMLKRWDRDGHLISFFMGDSEKNREYCKDTLNVDPDKVCCFTGGNVLNCGFAVAMRFLHSHFIIVLGNDLSFPMAEDIDERRKGFYADGDYKTQDGKKDEAKNEIAWMAYEHEGRSTIEPSLQLINYNKVLTSRQLLIYKAWIEMHVAKWSQVENLRFRYYNCSEGGICGVLALNHDKKFMESKENWTLMDEIAPGRWFTKPLVDAFQDFMEIKQCLTPTVIPGSAGNVVNLQAKTDIVKGVAQVGQNRIITSL